MDKYIKIKDGVSIKKDFIKESTAKRFLLRRVKFAVSKKEQAQQEFEEAILEAREICTLREIASVAGISNPHVLTIERKAKAKNGIK